MAAWGVNKRADIGNITNYILITIYEFAIINNTTQFQNSTHDKLRFLRDKIKILGAIKHI